MFSTSASQPGTTRVILVRHGRSTYNDQGRYQGGSDDAVLTDKGRATAQQVGRYLRSFAIAAIYSSPLRRVQQTASEIIQAHGQLAQTPLIIHNDLREIEMGAWQGLTYQQVKTELADDYCCWQQRPAEFMLGANGTLEVSGSAQPQTSVAIAAQPFYPVRELYQRAKYFWQQLLAEQVGKTILVVSHGGTNQALINTALGLEATAHHGSQQSNCGISLLSFETSRSAPNKPPAQLLQLNQTTALGETAPKLKAGKQGLRLMLIASEGLCDRTCAQLAERLQPLSIAFCLTADQSQRCAQQLLQQHPAAAHLTTGNAGFLQDWQQALAQSERRSDELMTGVAIAPAASIQRLLWQTLSRDSTESGSSAAGAIDEALPLQPGRLQVIHYPFAHHPVVQAINF